MMACESCGASCVRKSAMQKYCPSCSAVADLKRKRRWAQSHKLPRATASDAVNRRRLQIEGRGAALNEEERAGLWWPAELEEPELTWLVRTWIPFNYAASKNHAWSRAARGHVFLRREHKDLRDALVYRLRAAMPGRTVVEDRVWLDILVQKPDHRGDAVNVLDMVCDAVKEATGVDDRWYCVRRLDWQIVKQEPRLYVGVGQADSVPKRVCSKCGRVRPVNEFPGGTQIRRICAGCRRKDGAVHR